MILLKDTKLEIFPTLFPSEMHVGKYCKSGVLNTLTKQKLVFLTKCFSMVQRAHFFSCLEVTILSSSISQSIYISWIAGVKYLFNTEKLLKMCCRIFILMGSLFHAIVSVSLSKINRFIILLKACKKLKSLCFLCVHWTNSAIISRK